MYDEYGFRKNNRYPHKSESMTMMTMEDDLRSKRQSPLLEEIYNNRTARHQKYKTFGNMYLLTTEKKKMKRLCRNGIPDKYRGRVWYFCSGASKVHEEGLFQENPIFEVIERDVHTMLSWFVTIKHVLFTETDGQGQKSLRNILRAYALYDPEVGYCQGMGMVAGVMLMNMPEEESFWLLAATIKTKLQGFYAEDLHQIQIDALVFESLLYKTSRKLARHLESHDIRPIVYLPQWFLTLSLKSCLGLLKDVLLRKCPSNSEIIDFLLHLPRTMFPPERLFKKALRLRLKTTDIERLRERAKHMRK
ncbi:rab-GTPase-TBC domain-containing protein [Chytridium lagenaria]|nr:rab-GTPase-TBC domain-containing protein [Chytridium lagenaria]